MPPTPPPPPAPLALIPARFASTRFPGKPLADDTGKPLILHVLENAQRSNALDRVVVATDDHRIYTRLTKAAGPYAAVMTKPEHPNGTARLAEAANKLHLADPDQIIVNIQGDEPEIDPDVIDRLIARLAAEDPKTGAPMATLAAPFNDDEDPENPNIVKLVCDQNSRALYFSRALIPFTRDPASDPASTSASASASASASSSSSSSPPVSNAQDPGPIFKHPGLYAYRRHFLETYLTLDPTPLEQTEKLEQLRVIEHGFPIAVAILPADLCPHPGIDTPEQYAAFVARQKSRS